MEFHTIRTGREHEVGNRCSGWVGSVPASYSYHIRTMAIYCLATQRCLKSYTQPFESCIVLFLCVCVYVCRCVHVCVWVSIYYVNTGACRKEKALVPLK